jgi:hypothetical protein
MSAASRGSSAVPRTGRARRLVRPWPGEVGDIQPEPMPVWVNPVSDGPPSIAQLYDLTDFRRVVACLSEFADACADLPRPEAGVPPNRPLPPDQVDLRSRRCDATEIGEGGDSGPGG